MRPKRLGKSFEWAGRARCFITIAPRLATFVSGLNRIDTAPRRHFCKYNANVNCALAQKYAANENLKVRICKRDEKTSRATRKYGALLAGVENIGLAPICGSTVEILNRARLGSDIHA